LRKDGGKFQSRRHGGIERRRAERYAEPAHIHVALDECMTLDDRAGGMTAAPRSAEVDHVRQVVARVSIVGEPPRQRVRGIHLADSAIEHRYTALLEPALPFELECHHDQPARK
jgi:hypothetical protein